MRIFLSGVAAVLVATAAGCADSSGNDTSVAHERQPAIEDRKSEGVREEAQTAATGEPAAPTTNCGDIKDISDWPIGANDIKVRGVDCGFAHDFVLARAADCQAGECSAAGYTCQAQDAFSGSVNVFCLDRDRRVEWWFYGGY